MRTAEIVGYMRTNLERIGLGLVLGNDRQPQLGILDAVTFIAPPEHQEPHITISECTNTALRNLHPSQNNPSLPNVPEATQVVPA